MNNFYVYRWIRQDTSKPFYAGKGRGKRAFQVSNRNDRFKKIYAKYPCKVEIVFSNLNENDAFEKEIKLIALYKKYGLCEANFTLGGQGSSGVAKSEETRMKISLKKKGCVSPRKGVKLSTELVEKLRKSKLGHFGYWNNKEFSEEHRRKLSESKLGKITHNSQKIICIETGITYDSQTRAAKETGLTRKIISSSIKNNKAYNNMTFKRI